VAKTSSFLRNCNSAAASQFFLTKSAQTVKFLYGKNRKKILRNVQKLIENMRKTTVFNAGMHMALLPSVTKKDRFEMRTFLLPILLLAALILGTACGFAKTIPVATADSHVTEAGYRMSASKAVVMNLSGTTPISEWNMTAHGIQGTAEISLSNGTELTAIDGLTFDLPVHNLKGEHEAMDEHAYAALKADEYKDIVFQLVSATIVPCGTHCYRVMATGTLTVAGVTRTVTLSMQSKVNADGTVVFTGSQALRMSDYNVERPSLLFGAIRARDEMTLTYTLIFTK